MPVCVAAVRIEGEGSRFGSAPELASNRSRDAGGRNQYLKLIDYIRKSGVHAQAALARRL
ncbi:hypothetical protein AB0N06_30140 [Streptomyces sp. NPDC051020]|uniref:hypothetical protein n=1 Tax=Streptomyces sp. NPDC051020 TaxID=3155409 RepID=UPI003419B808